MAIDPAIPAPSVRPGQGQAAAERKESATDVARPADLVLEGGGVKGIGLVGAILALDAAGFRFQRVAGTSAGAIAASLIAALQAAGEPISRITGIMSSIEYPKFMDRTVLGEPELAERLVVHRGLYNGMYLTEWLGGQLEKIGVTKFSQLRCTDAGLDSTLTDSQRYTLVVHTSDITRRRLARFPWDYPYYGRDPDEQLIVDAVRASMSIPFFFEPVRFDATAATVNGVCFPEETVTLVDGGILSNFPIEVFDRADGVAARWPTIGIKLSGQQTVMPVSHDRDDLIGETIDCLKTVLDNVDRYYLTPDKVASTIFVDNSGVSTTDFHLTADQQQLLLKNGRKAGDAYIASHPVV
jgi:NTE family protein